MQTHPATKGVRQKEFGKRVMKKTTASEKVTERVTERGPKTKKSDRTPFADLLLQPNAERDHVERGFAAKPPEKCSMQPPTPPSAL